MRFMIMSLFLISVFAAQVFAGPAVTLEEAESLFFQNNLDVKSARTSLQKADADVLEAGVWPNPVARYYRESLGNGEKSVEETYSLSQSIDLFGVRAKTKEAARKSRAAQGHFTDRDVAELLLEMKRAFYRALLLKENEQALLTTADRFADTEAKMRERMQAGDVSEAELMKLVSERKKVERSLEALRVKLGASKANLGLMLGFGPEDIDATGELTSTPPELGAKEITELAVANNPELKGLTAAAESSEALLSAAKRGRAPWIELEGGYRKNTEGFTGPILGVSVPLPLFDRKRGAAARSRAEMTRAKFALESGKRSVSSEAALLTDTVRSLQARIDDLSRQVETSRELSAIAGLAYEEGESGLLELLEAVRSEKDLAIEYHEALYELHSTIFRLEALSGAKLVKRGEVR